MPTLDPDPEPDYREPIDAEERRELRRLGATDEEIAEIERRRLEGINRLPAGGPGDTRSPGTAD